jgi:UDP-N-acetylmuramoylalanine--D-glutamate ligase
MKIIVFGLGITGKAIVEFFLSCIEKFLPISEHFSKNLKITIIDDKVKSFEDANFDFSDNIMKKCYECVNFTQLVQFIDQNSNDNSSDIDEIDLHNVDYVFASPGIKLDHPFYKKIKDFNNSDTNFRGQIKITNDIEFFIDIVKNNNLGVHNVTLVGVTGSNGKSTTVSLIKHIMAEKWHACGNIGISPLKCVANELNSLDGNVLEGKNSINQNNYVIEISSAQLINIRNCSELDFSVLLNITPNHFEVHGNMEEYIKQKSKICSAKKCIISLDNSNTAKIYQDFKDKYNFIPISIEKILEDGFSLVNGVIYNNHQEMFNINDITIAHIPLHNILVAIIIAIHNSIEIDVIKNRLSSFTTLNHRLEKVLEIKLNRSKLTCNDENSSNLFVEFINDSKSTTIDASNFALKYLKSVNDMNPTIGSEIFWIVGGGDAKNQDFTRFQEILHIPSKIFVIGQAKNRIFDAIKEDFNQNIFVLDHMDNVLEYIKCYLIDYEKSNDAKDEIDLKDIKDQSDRRNCLRDVKVLLSPACESFDQYKNFNHRGDYFKEKVQEIFSKYKK